MAYQSLLRTRTVVLGKGPTSTQALKGSVKLLERTPKEKVDVPVVRIASTSGKKFDWTKIIRELQMGQSENMLIGKNDPALQKSYARVGNFVDHDSIQAKVTLARVGGLDMDATIVSVKKFAPGEIVVTVRPAESSSHIEVLCNRLFSCLGSGPELSHGAPVQRRSSGLQRPFGEELVGSEALSQQTKMFGRSVIVIIGDGPTALWVAQRALYNGCIPYVIGPNSDKAFKNASPGGRNDQVLEILRQQDLLMTANLEGLEELGRIRDFADPIEPGILAYFKDLNHLGSGKSRRSTVLPVSRVVSAIGSEHCLLPCFGQNLVSSLKPIVSYGPDGQASVGLATPDYDVLVAGAQALSHANAIGLGAEFSFPGNRLSQPGPGIVPNRHNLRAIVRTLQAVNLGASPQDVQLMTSLFMSDEVDPYSASQLEIKGFLHKRWEVPSNAADQIAAAIVKKRKEVISGGGEFGNLELAAEVEKLASE